MGTMVDSLELTQNLYRHYSNDWGVSFIYGSIELWPTNSTYIYGSIEGLVTSMAPLFISNHQFPVILFAVKKVATLLPRSTCNYQNGPESSYASFGTTSDNTYAQLGIGESNRIRLQDWNKKGKHNVAADALSRKECQGTLAIILIAKAKESWKVDHKLQKTVDTIHMTPQPCKNFWWWSSPKIRQIGGR